MRRAAALTAGCLMCLQAMATPVRDWPSPGLELSAGRGDVSIRGHVASTAHLSELGEAAASGARSLVGDDTYKHILLPDYWRESSTLLVSLLAGMHSGDAAMTRDELTLRGTLAENMSAEILESRLRQSVPANVSISIDVWAAASPVQACGALLATLLDAPFRLRSGEVNVSGEHFPRLNRIADALSRCPSLRLRISGHTDSSGDADDNLRISELRARAYADYLAGQGVMDKRLVWEGRGSAEPVASNRNATGRNRNRRVAIEIYSPP